MLVVLSAAPPAALAADPNETLKIERPGVSLPAPGFEAAGLNRSMYRLADYRGNVVLLHFWATFCAPCRRELPALQHLLQRFQSSGLAILAVSADRGSPNQVSRFVREQGLSLPVVLDPDGAVRRKYEVFALPITYIVGRDGKIRGRVVGAGSWDAPLATRLIQRLLNTDQLP